MHFLSGLSSLCVSTFFLIIISQAFRAPSGWESYIFVWLTSRKLNRPTGCFSISFYVKTLSDVVSIAVCFSVNSSNWNAFMTFTYRTFFREMKVRLSLSYESVSQPGQISYWMLCWMPIGTLCWTLVWILAGILFCNADFFWLLQSILSM